MRELVWNDRHGDTTIKTLRDIFNSVDDPECQEIQRMFHISNVEQEIRLNFENWLYPFDVLLRAGVRLEPTSYIECDAYFKILDPDQMYRIVWSYGYVDSDGFDVYEPWSGYDPSAPDWIGSLAFIPVFEMERGE